MFINKKMKLFKIEGENKELFIQIFILIIEENKINTIY